MITLTVRKVEGIIGKSIGLIGKKPQQHILLKTRFGIHTFGMKFPIDVLILDNKHKVIALRTKLMPNRLFFWNPKYDTVIESPANTIDKNNIKAGDQVVITYS